ncbi:MAG: UDP-N-acetylmuramate--L-alanine ligase [Firmicutes bacterium ADurb.Bin300]|nr:MAG: UDP-N-acetylmuramate--L-alanine ligase [Firmicutes bacterium ADurb.Bin300]HOD01915.1 UDP-N-acetylmuramate--L-alanine ligase [Clostridiales bacterium]
MIDCNIDNVLNNSKSIHFIGIGGAGMCPLAEIFHSRGYKITGSDNNESDTLKRIRTLDIKVTLGHKAENVDGADMVVYTAALMPDNPELCAAREKGIPIFERSKLFGAYSRRFDNCVGISGTHGKTTVTAMATQILVQAGLSPSALIGGRLPLTNSNGVVGRSQHFICEACEYKNTFHELSPNVSVILNVDCDHMEFFKTEDNLIASFRHFARMAKSCVIFNGDDEKTVKAVKAVSGKKLITFGRSASNDCYATNIELLSGAFASFDVWYLGKKLGRIKLGIPGEHNIYNALAAICIALYCNADFRRCRQSLEAFKGAGRRFEILGEYKGAVIADDYAHHPKELEVTLKTAKAMRYKRVWAVFQPFTFSRTKILLNDFARALSIADKVVLTKIMGSREKNIYGINTQDLANEIEGSVWFDSFDEVANHIKDNVKEGDLVITLGCGDVYKIAQKILGEK